MPRHHIAPRGGMAANFSILSPDVTVKGNVNASADLHVEGKVEGDITCQGLVQGEGSQIAGAIRAKSAKIAGTVRGTITAREVVILKSARITGDVHYDALTIEQGAKIDGRLSPGNTNATAQGQPESAVPATATKPPLAIAAQ